MDEQEPKEQFEATDYDEDGNIKLPPPVLTPPKKKRITVAELNKAIDDIRDVKFPETLNWIGELDTRLDQIESEMRNAPLDDIDAQARRIDNQDAAIGALADALRTYGEGIADWGSRMEECEDSITSLQTANADIQESAEHTELEFAQPPVQMAGGTADISAIAIVAAVCQTMTDVLTITRALKEVPELTDAERKEILYIAGRASGVIITPGLQIRAGVKFTGA